MKISELKYIVENGTCLDSQGIKNWALTKEQALNALDEIVKKNFIVLGGDVLEKKNAFFQNNYDSWYYEVDKKFSQTENSEKSVLKAKEYIESYQKNSETNFFFSLVVE